jgi:hypothetical protein
MASVTRDIAGRDAATRGWLDEPPPKLQHAFVMLGTDPLLLCHLTMFHVPEHRFQAILDIHLDDNVMAKLAEERKAHPNATYFLGNTAKEANQIRLTELKSGRKDSFEAEIFRGIPEKPFYRAWPFVDPVIKDVKVTLKSVVLFRQFDFDVPPPEDVTYILFGSKGAAYMTHYQTSWPTFDQVVTLGEQPPWIDAEHIECAVPITFRGIRTRPGGELRCESPLSVGTYEGHYDGAGHYPGGTTGPIKVGRIDWFSTKIVNMPKDPCYVCDEPKPPQPNPPHHPLGKTSRKGTRGG